MAVYVSRKLLSGLLGLFRPAKLSLRHWKHDVIAGTIVTVVAIPLCLALAVASGVPPAYGLYTAIIGGAIVAVFGGTELGVAGPAAAMTVLLYSVAAKFGVQGLLMAGFLAGILQIAMGISGIGRVVKFIPYTVVVGFTTGIGLLIILGQLGNLSGVAVSAEGALAQMAALISHLNQASLAALALSATTLAVLWGIPRLTHKIPASFVALVTATGVSVIFSWTWRTSAPFHPVSRVLRCLTFHSRN